MIFELSR